MAKLILLVSIFFLISACGGGSSDAETDITELIVVQAPTNVVATSRDGKITLTWTTVANVTYDVYLSTEDGLDYKNYSSFDNSEWIMNTNSPFEFIPENLANKYYFTIVGRRGSTESEQSDIVSSVPRYNDLGDTVVDLYTNLIWQKCPIGQTFDTNSNRCIGTPSRLSHDQAIQIINSSYPDWRIPEANELISLVYCESGMPSYFLENVDQSCNVEGTQPVSIYSQIFTNTLVDINYRTSSTRTVSGFESTTFYESVSFAGGRLSNFIGGEPTGYYTRLVRSL